MLFKREMVKFLQLGCPPHWGARSWCCRTCLKNTFLYLFWSIFNERRFWKSCLKMDIFFSFNILWECEDLLFFGIYLSFELCQFFMSPILAFLNFTNKVVLWKFYKISKLILSWILWRCLISLSLMSISQMMMTDGYHDVLMMILWWWWQMVTYHLRCTRTGRMGGISACTQTCIPWWHFLISICISNLYLYLYSDLFSLVF